ncbi:MAG TPA: hypothetical protein VF021_10780, partial [Longimicrobiales bacterium]
PECSQVRNTAALLQRMLESLRDAVRRTGRLPGIPEFAAALDREVWTPVPEAASSPEQPAMPQVTLHCDDSAALWAGIYLAGVQKEVFDKTGVVVPPIQIEQDTNVEGWQLHIGNESFDLHDTGEQNTEHLSVLLAQRVARFVSATLIDRYMTVLEEQVPALVQTARTLLGSSLYENLRGLAAAGVSLKPLPGILDEQLVRARPASPQPIAVGAIAEAHA